MRGAFVFALVACLAGVGTYFGATAFRANASAPTAHHARATTLTAAEFGRALAGAANQAGGAARITNTHCVQARPGAYMCAYTIVRHGRRECHLMQGRWTPKRASSITVTLAGRTRRCATLRDAIESLG